MGHPRYLALTCCVQWRESSSAVMPILFIVIRRFHTTVANQNMPTSRDMCLFFSCDRSTFRLRFPFPSFSSLKSRKLVADEISPRGNLKTIGFLAWLISRISLEGGIIEYLSRDEMPQTESHKLHEKSRNLCCGGCWLALKGLDKIKIKIKILGSSQLAFPAIAEDQDLRILDGAPTSEGCQNDRLTISMV